MDIEQDNGNINAQILAQTTAEQEQKKRIVRFILACAGVSFPNSTWYVYVIQVLGLAAQGWVLYILISFLKIYANNDDIDGRLIVQLQTFYILDLFIQVFPWCYLCFLTRSSERQYLDKIIENLTVKWWMVAVPFVPNLAIALLVSLWRGGAIWFFFLFFLFLPASISILMLFAYVAEFEKNLPMIRSINDIKENVLTYQKETREKIKLMNIALLIPNVSFWAFITLDFFWLMVDNLENNYTHDAVFYAIVTVFNLLFTLSFLVPPVAFTHVVNDFVTRLDKQFCEEDNGVLGWLRSSKHGWEVFSVEMSPEMMTRILYVVVGACLTYFSKKIF